MKKHMFLFLLLFAAGSIQAQKETALYLTNGIVARGFLSKVTQDSLFLAQPYEGHYAQREDLLPLLAYSRWSVQKVEIGQGTSILGSTLIGLGIGAAAGGIMAATVDANSFMAPVAQIMLFSVGTVGGLVTGLVVGTVNARDKEEYYPLLDADFAALLRYHGGVGNFEGSQIPSKVSTPCGQPEYMLASAMVDEAMYSVAAVRFILKDGSEFVARPICVTDSIVTILPEVEWFRMFKYRGPFVLVPTTAISSVSSMPSDALWIGAISGAFAVPFLATRLDESSGRSVFAEIGAGALAGAGIAWIISAFTSSSWEWQAGSSIELLQQHSLYKQSLESISVKE